MPQISAVRMLPTIVNPDVGKISKLPRSVNKEVASRGGQAELRVIVYTRRWWIQSGAPDSAESRQIAYFERASRGSSYREMSVRTQLDRKSTRLNSSHSSISYAVF